MNYANDQLTSIVLFVLALSHALLTWQIQATTALFAGGIGIAFVFEGIIVNSGLLQHKFRPQIASVPITILLAWPSVVYIPYRVALFVTSAVIPAAVLTAVIATLGDLFTDPIMVERGAWEYPESVISQPRIRGIPWWNFVGWICIVFITALLPAFATS